MKTVKYKPVLLTLMTVVLAFAFTGCYTQLAKAPERVYYDEPYDEEVEEPVESEYTYDDDDGYGLETPDTIIVDRSAYPDIYVQDWVPTVYIDAWWYSPYWHYRTSSWWRWHHRWDPWYGYNDYWGDPWYWPSFSYYGGWGFYDPWYGYAGYWGSPYYYHHHNGWGWGGGGWGHEGQYRDWERRSFGVGN